MTIDQTDYTRNNP